MICLTPKQFEMEGSGFEITMEKVFRGSQKAWNSILKPTINTFAPVIGIAIGSKSKSPQVGQATASFFEIDIGGGVNFIAHRPSRWWIEIKGYVNHFN